MKKTEKEKFIKRYWRCMFSPSYSTNIEIEEKQKSKIPLTIFDDVPPKAKELTAQNNVVKIAKDLFSYKLKGLNRYFEPEPQGSGILLALTPLNFETNTEKFIENLLAPIRLARTNSGFNIEEKEIKDVVGLYLKYWETDTWPYEVIVPLHNFDSEVDEATIGNITIHKTSTLEGKAGWWTLQKELEGVNYFLSTESCFWGPNPEEWNILVSDINQAISALRLVLKDQYGFFKEGIGLSDLNFLALAPITKRVHSYKAALPNRVNPATALSKLSKKKLPKLKKEDIDFIKNYIDEPKNLSDLNFAIRRFNLSYSREDDADRLIDLTIALESCLLATESNELKYRLSLRAARLLSDEYHTKFIERLMNKTYDYRSRIVHNGMEYKNIAKSIDKDFVDYEISYTAFIPQLSEVVRHILLKLIENISLINKTEKKVKSPLKFLCQNLDQDIIAALD